MSISAWAADSITGDFDLLCPSWPPPPTTPPLAEADCQPEKGGRKRELIGSDLGVEMMLS